MKRRKLSPAEANLRHDLDLARSAFQSHWARLSYWFSRATKARKRVKYLEKKLKMLLIAEELHGQGGSPQ